MKLAIKNPAPEGSRQTFWGDYSFGGSLQRALEELGIEVVQHFWPDWDRDDGEDAILVLRGKRLYVPPRDKVSMLWVISHPATVSLEELNRYSVAFVASEKLYSTFAPLTSTPLEVMRQCTDVSLFAPPGCTVEEDAKRREGVVFVANSRGVRRDMLQWSLAAGRPPRLIGGHWDQFGLADLVYREHVRNSELPEVYHAAKASLNDHWADMRHFGIINNRVFDCMACGVPVVTDSFAELRSVIGDAALYANNADEFQSALEELDDSYASVLSKVRSWWDEHGTDYSFSARAEQILRAFDRLEPKGAEPGAESDTPDLGEARAFFDELLRQSDLKRSGRRKKVVLVNPTQRTLRAVTANDDVAHVSAGFGDGPWQVALDGQASQLEGAGFDLVWIEQTDTLLNVSPAERLVAAQGLARSMSILGVLGVSPAGGNERAFVDALGWAGLETLSDGSYGTILGRASASRSVQEMEALSRKLNESERRYQKLKKRTLRGRLDRWLSRS
ncbi:glycosyltransferase [Thioalkalivibrio sp. ALE19]|uniref:glycosyltransferase family protein n=1 Tax=Thioalkalivibrio sp. ALE19 TaxID=1266909 RepID=UPI000426DF53|nr:glycosyltransferase [Thioalkalivibrio sp. ALE19]